MNKKDWQLLTMAVFFTYILALFTMILTVRFMPFYPEPVRTTTWDPYEEYWRWNEYGYFSEPCNESFERALREYIATPSRGEQTDPEDVEITSWNITDINVRNGTGLTVRFSKIIYDAPLEDPNSNYTFQNFTLTTTYSGKLEVEP